MKRLRKWIAQNTYTAALLIVVTSLCIGVIFVLNAYANTLTYYKPLFK